MRYADGPSVGHGIHVNAPASRIWTLVTDIEMHALLSPELERVTWRGGAAGPALGASFVGENRHGALGNWRTLSYITELEYQRLFGWAVVDLDGRFGTDAPDPAVPLAAWRFEVRLEPRGARLCQSVRIGPARSGLSLAIDRTPEKEEALLAIRLDELGAGIRATLSGIKALAEKPSCLR